MRQRAFTLLELLLVVIVVGTLATLGLPRYAKLVDCRLQKEARDTLAELLTGDQVYRLKHGKFTGDIAELPMLDPHHGGNPLAYNITGTTDTFFNGITTHATKPYKTLLQYNADTKTRCLNETSWPCPLITESGC